MFHKLMKPKFYKKCKSATRSIKMRLETIKRKRNAVEKYLRSDIVELLKNGLDYNAFGRVEGFLIEKNMAACYNRIEQFIECISKNVSVMQKQSECPEECKEAIPSLIFAAARFSDLPELRDLRTIFTEKYGNSLEPFINQEFVKRLRGEPPTKETKLQLMHDLAQEFSIEWDSKALEQKLFKPPPQQNEAWDKSLNDDDKQKLYRNKNDTFPKSDSEDEESGLNNIQEYSRPKGNETDLASRGRKKEKEDKYKQHSSSEEEMTDQDLPRTSSTSVESVSEDSIDNRKPFYYRFFPPPYARQSLGKGKSSTDEPTKPTDNTDKEKNNTSDDSVGKQKPRSVRTRPLKLPPGREGLSSNESNGAANNSLSALEHKEAVKGPGSLQTEESGQTDEEEKMIDSLLAHYSQKKSRYESTSKQKANLAPSPRRKPAGGTGDGLRFRSTKSDPISSPPARATTVPKEETSQTETTARHTRASSSGPDMFGGHVHPKLPDYDDLAARLAALKRETKK